MTRIAWTGDLHLDFVSDAVVSSVIDDIGRREPDALLITGDTSEAPALRSYLRRFHAALAMPIFIVLGNHDFYGSSIARTRRDIRRLCAEQTRIVYLTLLRAPTRLDDHWALVGVDGWGDGRVGAYRSNEVLLSDWNHIEEFKRLRAMFDIDARLRLLNRLGDEAAEQLRVPLEKALDAGYDTLVATHVPPFVEAAWHDGKPSQETSRPWFVCKAVGDVLANAAARHPTRRILVLCSHTHGRGSCRMAPNLEVRTSGVDYGAPGLEDVLHL